VPSEILAKPGTLTTFEFALVRAHSQAGHDILSGIHFPWPVAEIVLQHHERLDGSGYPNGLKDGQIRLEAKILAVADVVEAMSAYRPYRPSLGLPAALDELVAGRGILYDETAVDACVTLFSDEGFAFD
jgi:HD-GYP domain-containing protein (c-di-GMP phosphodiesterase class II)